MNQFAHYATRSMIAGDTWTERVRVNTVATNDQWMPVLTVKPDGTQLFIGWYDRRHDPNNSLIEVYGRFASIATNGSVTFADELRITTISFAPVFAGIRGEVEPIYKQSGYYDPVYPPRGVNLHWWYSEWPDNPNEFTAESYESHVGEYNGAWPTSEYVYVTWTDGRLPSAGARQPCKQRDVRLVRLPWPE